MSDAYSPIPELNALKEFEDSLGGQFFAPGFEMFAYNDDLDWFCGDAPDAYLDRLIPFAYATGSGSYYALWRCDGRAGLATLPVLGFGDEGGLWVEACDLRGLFRLLAAEADDPEDRARVAPARQRASGSCARRARRGPARVRSGTGRRVHRWVTMPGAAMAMGCAKVSAAAS
ncbi:hypothetical protein ACFZCY_10720 [Streptomyces sp. NPDC007983]|uniref:hypothetical protein n=1 Tax=Streptomyces sp. NPDC007983 TaxID=3364800 RepID=UPI0036E00C7C